jgi:nitrite reductase/ring-hydroxylating ferredoxin subunit
VAAHVVASVGEIPPGSKKRVTVEGRQMVVANLGGEYFALLDRCPHAGARLSDGTLVGLVESTEPGSYSVSRRGEILRCPWHGWEYDVRTGQSWCDPGRVRVRRYQARVEPGRTVAQGPYVVETFPVTVEESYVVVDL